MELQALKVSTRASLGKGAARQIRREGAVPGVLYGAQKESVSLRVNARDLDNLLHGSQGEHALIELQVEDQPDLNGPAMVKAVQHHPVRGQVIHADLLRIDLTKKIQTMVQISIVGQSMGVIEGGVIDHQSREIEIMCLPMEVPESFEVDISELDIGDNIHVADVAMPDGVEILTPGDRTIVAVHAPRVVVEDEVVDEEGLAEGEEGAEGAEGAEGGDSADGDSDEKSKD